MRGWVVGALLVGAAAVGAGVLLGWLLGLTVVAGGAVGVWLLRRTGALGRVADEPRAQAAASAVALAVAGMVFMQVLVANPSDNAYLWIWLLGVVLVGLAVPFMAAVLAPAGGLRRRLAQAGVALVWAAGAPGTLLLLLGAPLYALSSAPVPPGARTDSRVVPAHLAAAALLAALVWLVGYALPRWRTRPTAADRATTEPDSGPAGV